LARHGESIVVYFLCKTVEAFSKLGQMITSGFMHAVFTVVIQTTAARTTVDIYVRADEFSVRLLCLTAPQDKGQPLFRHAHLISDSCVSPKHNTKVGHSSDTHTWPQTLVSYLTTTQRSAKVGHSSDTHSWPQTIMSHLTTTQRSVTLQTHTLDLRLLCFTSAQHKGRSLIRHTQLTTDSYVSPHHKTNMSHSSDTHTWPQTFVSHLTTTQRSVTLQTHTLDLRLLCLTSAQHKDQSLFRHTHLTTHSCVSPCRKTFIIYTVLSLFHVLWLDVNRWLNVNKLISLQHRVRAMKSHIQNSTNHFFLG